MNILYDATLIGHVTDNRCRRGIFFVVVNVLREFLLRKDVSVILYYHPRLVSSLDFFKEKFKEIFPEFELPLIANEQSNLFNQCDVDVILNLWLWIPEEFNDLYIDKFLYVYDMMALRQPGYEDFLSPGGWFYNVCASINRNNYYITDSVSAKHDVLKLFPSTRKDQIKVAYLAANSSSFRPISESKREFFLKKIGLRENEKFIFALCSIESRKNLLVNVVSFLKFISKNNIKNLYFIIGGEKWNEFSEQLDRYLNSSSESVKYIKKVGYVDDEDLPYYYSFSEWFVYTSQFEGFGLPVIEAMACGSPVIASNSTSLPEVCGEAALLINPLSVEDHIVAYEKYWYDDELRLCFKDKSIQNSKRFSWTKTVDDILDFINGVYDCTKFVPLEEIRLRLNGSYQRLETCELDKNKIYFKYKLYSLLSKVTFGKVSSCFMKKKMKYKDKALKIKWKM